MLIEIRSVVTFSWGKGMREFSGVMETFSVLICICQNLIESYTQEVSISINVNYISTKDKLIERKWEEFIIGDTVQSKDERK